MGQRYQELAPRHTQFIGEQKLFFVGTATADSRVNVSPKGMDCLRVLGPRRVAWLNVTGSGNETAAHLSLQPRMTLMFCAFVGAPLILRVYGNARAVHHNDPEWTALSALFPALPGARQVFDLAVDLVQTSCGMAVPFFDFAGEREALNAWAVKKGDSGVRDYWKEKNQLSLDGIASDIVARNI
jgi:hypothetical protein